MTEEELERCIVLYRKMVWSAALCYVKNPADADDIAQDVFLKLYTYDGSFENEEHIKAWLLKCAVNRSKNILRSHWYRFSQPLEAAVNKEYLDDKDSGFELPELFGKISPKNRIALYLHYIEGYSVEETARLLNISKSAAGVRLMRGRKQLEKLIADERGKGNELQKDC